MNNKTMLRVLHMIELMSHELTLNKNTDCG